jgi:hypothetical protein
MELRNKARRSGALIRNSRCILTANRLQIMNVKTANHSEKEFFLKEKNGFSIFCFSKLITRIENVR